MMDFYEIRISEKSVWEIRISRISTPKLQSYYNNLVLLEKLAFLLQNQLI